MADPLAGLPDFTAVPTEETAASPPTPTPTPTPAPKPGKFDPVATEKKVREYAAKFGVDPDFAADTSFFESSFNPKAVGPKIPGRKERAQGAMQVLPSTAKSLEKRYGKDNIAQGVGYLKDLNDMFVDIPEDQRKHFVSAAYNMGPTVMMRMMADVKKKGGDPFSFSSYADVLPEETAKRIRNMGLRAASRGGQTVPGEETPAGPELAPTTEPPAPQPRRIQPLGEALMSSLEAGGRRATQAVRQAGESISGLAAPFEGEPTVGAALKRSGGTILDVLHALGPALYPKGAVGSAAAETLQRTGNLEPIRNVPLLGRMAESPEAAATGGELLTAAVPLGAAGISKVTRSLSPRLQAAEKAEGAVAKAIAKNAPVQAANEAQLAAQVKAGTQVPEVASAIEGRLAKAPAVSARQLQTLEGKAPTGLVDAAGKPLASFKPADYTKAFDELKTVNARAAEAARNFDRTVTQRLKNVPAKNIANNLREDKELAAGLLAHASPAEAQIINTAIESGKPLSALPVSPEQIERLGEAIVGQRSMLGPLLHSMGGAGLGYFVGGTTGGAIGGPGGIIAGHLAMKVLDAAIASKSSRFLLKQLGRLEPGSPEAVRILLAAGADVAGPRRLQPRGE